MQMRNGTVPHVVKVQVGAEPDPARDAEAYVWLPLDEAPYAVGTQLAELARAMISVSKILGSSHGEGLGIDVDGTACRITVSDAMQVAEPAMTDELGQKLSALVTPQGWTPA